jgi:hypothetical protein
LGKDHVEAISKQFADFYWPVPMHGVPGKVFVMPGGDFAGEIAVGQFMSKHDGAALTIQKIKKRIDAKVRHDKAILSLADLLYAESCHHASIGAFASIDAVIAAWKAGKGQTLRFLKNGVAATAIGNSMSMWGRSGGSVDIPDNPNGLAPLTCDATVAGALQYKNLGAAESGHFLNWSVNASVAGNSLLLYDRLRNISMILDQLAHAVTGDPPRYQSTTAGDDDYVGGNFAFMENGPIAALPATAHNWTVCTYLDQDAVSSTFPSVAGVASCVGSGIDLAAGQTSWFMPLAAGDIGVQTLRQYQVSASIGAADMRFVQGHPIAIQACPVANLACMDDGLYTSFGLAHIEDNACLSFIELPKPATTATTYAGIIRTVSE